MKSLPAVLPRRKGRYSYLLVLMLGQLLLSPWAQGYGARYRILGFLAAGAVLAALYAISESREVWIAGIILATPAFLHRVTLWPDLQSIVSQAGLASSILFDLFITAFILRQILRHNEISAQTIYGALCAYLTIGFAFGQIYVLIAAIRPDAFVLDPQLFHHTVAQQPDLMYYSYTALTTLGASGIAPAGPYSRCFSMVEGVLGVMYLSVLLGRLVGLNVSQRIMRASGRADDQSFSAKGNS